jgi:DNA damage-binding protein 1
MNLLITLQTNMADRVQIPSGGFAYAKYRAFRSPVRWEDEPRRFVDGEFVERFLDLDATVQEECIKGLDVSIDEVVGIVEGLKRLR